MGTGIIHSALMARNEFGGYEVRKTFPMISCVREVWRRLRWIRPPEGESDWRPEVLESLCWMHREHVKELGQLGYSAKEAFWLDFACLPFLPWSRSAQSSIELSTILDLYADLYHQTVGPLEPANAEAFAALLRQRYGSIGRMVAAGGGLHHDGARIDASEWVDSDQQKWALAGLVVLWTARQWQQHPSAFPCRLVED